jgi:hypothetical protein
MEAVPVTSGESGREGKMNIYVCTVEGSCTSYGLRRQDVPVVTDLWVLLMRILGKASEAHKEGTHRCVDVCPLGCSRARWEWVREAGWKVDHEGERK